MTLQLEAEAGVARNLVEADRVEHAARPVRRAGDTNTANVDERGVEAGQPRRLRFEPVA